MLDLREAFERHNANYGEFDLIKNPLHPRPDLCAFILLDKLVPKPGRDMVTAAEHDEIYLVTDCDQLAAVATDDDILMLVRCGVRYDPSLGALAMFV
jgi:hypothetical protein